MVSASNLFCRRAFGVLITILMSFGAQTSVSAVELQREDPELCLRQDEFFVRQLDHRASLVELGRQIASARAQIVLIGESHSERRVPFYRDILDALITGAPHIDCVSIEATEKNVDEFGYANANWKTLAEQAHRRGLRVFNTDGCEDPNPSDGLVCLRGRNRAMSRRLQELMHQQTCRAIIHVGGSGHFQDISPEATPNMQSRLRAADLKVFAVQIVDSVMDESAAHTGLSAWNWADPRTRSFVCPSTRPAMNETFAFLNQEFALSKSVPVFYWPPPWTLRPWSDFDAGIVLGQSYGRVAE